MSVPDKVELFSDTGNVAHVCAFSISLPEDICKASGSDAQTFQSRNVVSKFGHNSYKNFSRQPLYTDVGFGCMLFILITSLLAFGRRTGGVYVFHHLKLEGS